MHHLISKFLAMTAMAAGLSVTAPMATAAPSFSGPYAYGNWSTTFVHDGGTTVDTSSTSTLTIDGGNSGCPSINECIVHFSIQVPGTGVISFDWTFSTIDAFPFFEQFGFGLDGILTELTILDLAVESGTNVKVPVTIGQTFEFFYDCNDCGFGPGTAAVTNFSGPAPVVVNPPGTPVPEPGTMALMLAAGVALLGTGVRRRRVG